MHHEGTEGTKKQNKALPQRARWIRWVRGGIPLSLRSPRIPRALCGKAFFPLRALRGESKAARDGKEFTDLVGILVAGAALDAG